MQKRSLILMSLVGSLAANSALAQDPYAGVPQPIVIDSGSQMQQPSMPADVSVQVQVPGYDAQPYPQQQVQYAQQQPVQQAAPTDAVSYFYEWLAPYGQWMNSSLGLVWKPDPNIVGANFVPYLTGGHWVNSDQGWVFDSQYPFAWAVYHYGRWYQDPNAGWVWVPDTTWGPAWVDWREGSGFVGWMPMPPLAIAGYYDQYEPNYIFVSVDHFCGYDYTPWVTWSRPSYGVYGTMRSIPFSVQPGWGRWAVGPSVNVFNNRGVVVPRTVVTVPNAPGVVARGGVRVTPSPSVPVATFHPGSVGVNAGGRGSVGVSGPSQMPSASGRPVYNYTSGPSMATFHPGGTTTPITSMPPAGYNNGRPVFNNQSLPASAYHPTPGTTMYGGASAASNTMYGGAQNGSPTMYGPPGGFGGQHFTPGQVAPGGYGQPQGPREAPLGHPQGYATPTPLQQLNAWHPPAPSAPAYMQAPQQQFRPTPMPSYASPSNYQRSYSAPSQPSYSQPSFHSAPSFSAPSSYSAPSFHSAPSSYSAPSFHSAPSFSSSSSFHSSPAPSFSAPHFSGGGGFAGGGRRGR